MKILNLQKRKRTNEKIVKDFSITRSVNGIPELVDFKELNFDFGKK